MPSGDAQRTWFPEMRDSGQARRPAAAWPNHNEHRANKKGPRESPLGIWLVGQPTRELCIGAIGRGLG
jgi:hypothetical protein